MTGLHKFQISESYKCICQLFIDWRFLWCWRRSSWRLFRFSSTFQKKILNICFSSSNSNIYELNILLEINCKVPYFNSQHLILIQLISIRNIWFQFHNLYFQFSISIISIHNIKCLQKYFSKINIIHSYLYKANNHCQNPSHIFCEWEVHKLNINFLRIFFFFTSYFLAST